MDGRSTADLPRFRLSVSATSIMSQHVAFALPNNLPAPPVEPKLPLAVSSRKEQAVARTTASQQVRRSAGRGFAAALAVGLARRARVRPMVVASSPDETYEELVQGSVALKEEPWQKRLGLDA